MRRPRSFTHHVLVSGLALLSGVLVGGSPRALGAAAKPGAQPLKWDYFASKGVGISVYKPAALKLKMRAPKHGYQVTQGVEPTSKTQFAIYLYQGARTAAQLKQDVPRLTGIAATTLLPVLSLGPGKGFAWQRGFISQPKPGWAVSILLARHRTRPLSYVIVVQTSLATAWRYMRSFKKAYQGLKAIP